MASPDVTRISAEGPGAAARAGALAVLTLVAVPAGATTADDVGGCGMQPTRVVAADPSDYLAKLATLQPGDLLQLAAGTYRDGLDLQGLEGTSAACIFIAGPAEPPLAVFTARSCCNTVSLGDSSFLVIRNLELDGDGLFVDAVKAESPATYAHHITLENLWIHDHDVDQQAVGISTKCPAWNWVIRRNVIETTGTGAYLGDSTGQVEFVSSLIEHNLFLDTIGYNLQIKHQTVRDLVTNPGMPADGRTILRHNVFSKAANASTGAAARPNLLIGHMPASGPGADDDYLIYGNFFWQNTTDLEPLFQGEGHLAFYDNLLVNDVGPGVVIRNQNGPVRQVRVFHNTIVAGAAEVGIRIRDGVEGAYDQEARGNAIFAGTPVFVSDNASEAENTVGARGEADEYLTAPFGSVGVTLDLYPLVGALQGAVDATGLDLYEDWDRDFNFALRTTSFRGGYAGEGTNPGWRLALERKPEPLIPEIFSDGFESGDLTAWSSSTPP